jgi:hypothetical protein
MDYTGSKQSVYPLISFSMPVRYRKHEKNLQFIFGAIIALVLLQIIITVVVPVIKHLFNIIWILKILCNIVKYI